MRLKILVTGGSGRLGRALAAVGGASVRAPSRADLDVTDWDSVVVAVQRLRPSVVINAAVVSGIDRLEADPNAGLAVNASAPGQLAKACVEAGIPFVHISTDYVFGAPTNRPWRETDPTSPLNAYGRMKAEGELNVLGAGGRSCVVRVAWLFGDGNDFIVRLLRNRDGGPVRVAADQIGSPTPIFTLAKRLLALAEHMVSHAAIPPILHLAGSPSVSRADWTATAFEALARAGQQPPAIIRVSMAEFGSVAARPRYSALDCSVATELFAGPLDWHEQTTRPETFDRSV